MKTESEINHSTRLLKTTDHSSNNRTIFEPDHLRRPTATSNSKSPHMYIYTYTYICVT